MTPAGNDGQSLAELGIILGLMAIAVIVVLLLLGGQVSTQFGGVGKSV
jgi:Flp pilus assembly pilin Flp